MRPAAVLAVLVKAQGVSVANKQLMGVQSTLQRADKSATGMGKSVDRASKKGAKSIGLLKGSIGALGAVGGFFAVQKGVSAMVGEFREAQKTGAQTAAVLKSTGGAANVTAKDVERLSNALSRKVGIDDEVIQQSANMLLTFTKVRNEAGKGNQIFTEATRVVTDMGVALGVSGTKAAIQLGKALNDPIRGISALRRVGVTFDDQQQKQIQTMVKSGNLLGAQRMILAELTKEFGGSAAAQATAGDKLRVSLGNLAEAAGTVLVPVFDKVAVGMTKVINGFLAGEGAAGGFRNAVSSVSAVLSTNLTAAIQAVSKWMKVHRDDLNAVAHAARNVGVAIQWAWLTVALPVIQRVLPAIKQIVGGTFTAIGGMVDVLVGLLTLDFKRAWEGVKAIFKGGATAVLGIMRAMTAPIRELGSKIGDGLAAGFSKAWNEVKSIFRSAINAVIDFMNVLIRAINKIPGVPDIGEIGKIGGGRPGQQNLGGTGHLARGGSWGAGGMVRAPTVVMGEEAPRHPEFVIPTNPAYRGRAVGLLGAAAKALGFARGGRYSQGEIMDLWTGQHGASTRRLIASAIAMAESGGNANAVSANPAGGVNRGLWQIWSGNPGSTFDPAGNARTAIRMSGNGTRWGQWEAFTNGTYRAFMGKGRGAGGLPGSSDILGLFPQVTAAMGMFGGLGKYVLAKAGAWVKRQVSNLVGGAGSLGNKGAASGLSIGVQRAIELATGMGWPYPSPGQLTGGRHTKGSLHYSGRAVDFGTAGRSPGQTMGLWSALVKKFGLGLNELFYDPAGRYIDAHRWVTGAIGGHADHIHAGFRRGGKWLGSFARGGFTGGREGMAYLHKNEAVLPLKKGGGPKKGPKVSAKPSPWASAMVSVGGGKYVSITEYAQMIANGYDPTDTSRTLGPVTRSSPAAVDAEAANQALIDAMDRLRQAEEERKAVEERRIALDEEIAARQKRLDNAINTQGPAMIAAVVQAVSGGIGGRVGLGFQSPSYPGGVASYS